MASMEAAIVLTAFMVFILIVIAAGRVSDARTAVQTAAGAGARAASLERSARCRPQGSLGRGGRLTQQ